MPRFFILRFSIQLGAPFIAHFDLNNTLFLKKNGLSLSHFVQRYLDLNLFYFSYQNVLFNVFKYLVSIFMFDPVDPLFY